MIKVKKNTLRVHHHGSSSLPARLCPWQHGVLEALGDPTPCQRFTCSPCAHLVVVIVVRVVGVEEVEVTVVVEEDDSQKIGQFFRIS